MPATIEFSTPIEQLEMLMNVNYLHIPPSVVKKAGGLGKNKRFICRVNDTLEFQCGMMPLKKGSAYITLNKQRMKQLDVRTGDVVDVRLVEDNSKYGMPVPKELEEVLKQDPEGDERFHKLTPGKQRNIIYYVTSVKSSQLRIDRAIKLIQNLKDCPEGKETMRRIFGIE